MITSGRLSGSISSSIAGGNFWAGARQGVITSELNHVAHHIEKLTNEWRAELKGNNIKNYATFMSEAGAYSMNAAYSENLTEYNWAKEQINFYNEEASFLLKNGYIRTKNLYQ